MSPQSVSGAIFSQDRTQVLLVLRRDVPVWVLPGGGVDPGEAPENSVVREILEETGFHVKVVRLAGIYTPINHLARSTHLYECQIQSGRMTVSTETRGIRFFSIHNLPLMPPPFHEWVEDAYIVQPTVIRSLTAVTYRNLFKNFLFHPFLVFRFLLSRFGFPINS
jgi:8-oxo-dGTP diphosphatase